jgi:hypothetical protein
MTYRQLRRLAFLPILAATLTLTACDSNDPEEDEGAGEEEVISLVRITLTPQGGGTSVTAEARFNEDESEDGPPGTLRLQPGVTYNGTIDLQNTFETPPESITAEIREEDEAHRFFYTAEGDVADNVAVTITDRDGNGDPLGLTFTVVVSGGASESGGMRVKLRHYEDGAVFPDTKRNDTATAPEISDVVENDINIRFPVAIN